MAKIAILLEQGDDYEAWYKMGAGIKTTIQQRGYRVSAVIAEQKNLDISEVMSAMSMDEMIKAQEKIAKILSQLNKL